MSEGYVQIEEIRAGRVTAIKVSTDLVGRSLTGKGTAIQHPDDTYDATIGWETAFARALHDLADQLNAEARRFRKESYRRMAELGQG